MKIVTCDVCGKAIEPQDRSAHLAGQPLPPECGGLLGLMVKEMDVHRRCLEMGKRIDAKELFMQEWRKSIREQAETEKKG